MFWSMSISSRGFLRWTSPLLSHGKHPLHTCQSTLTMITSVCLLQWCSTWYSDQVQPSCRPAVANWYRKLFHVLFSYLCVTCSTVERTKPAMWVWQTPVYFYFFIAISMCRYCCPRSLHGGDPRAGKSHSTAVKNREKSSTVIQILYNHYFLSFHLSPLLSLHLSLSSPSISSSPLREGLLVVGWVQNRRP